MEFVADLSPWRSGVVGALFVPRRKWTLASRGFEPRSRLKRARATPAALTQRSAASSVEPRLGPFVKGGRRRAACALTLAVIALVGVGCSAGSTTEGAAPAVGVVSRTMAVPAVHYGRMAWTDDGLFIQRARQLETPNGGAEIWRVKSPPDGPLESLALQAHDSTCSSIGYGAPSVRIGKLTVVRQCLLVDNTNGGASFEVDEVGGSSTTKIASLDTEINPTDMTWSPDGSRAVASETSGICATLVWVDPPTWHPMAVTVGTHKRWRLDQELSSELRDDNCDRYGRADIPSWAPSGGSIAFFGSPQSIGVRGGDRTDKTWNLYVMAVSDSRPHAVIANVPWPGSLRWSPSGARLLFSQGAGRGKGTYLYDVATRSTTRLSTDNLFNAVWDPTGHRIAGLVDHGDPDRLELRMLEIE